MVYFIVVTSNFLNHCDYIATCIIMYFLPYSTGGLYRVAQK